jgi:Bacterial cadherin-like domain
LQFADLTVPSGVTAGAAPIAGADVGNVGSQSTTVGNVLANDFDFQALQGDETLTVSGVNGLPANVGNPITLASGALLNLNSNGTFTYDPNGAFDGLCPGKLEPTRSATRSPMGMAAPTPPPSPCTSMMEAA